jgi:beta-N-acetylhexosaminidase
LAELIGDALNCLGFNTNFAPLLDLATPFTEKTLGSQALGSDPAKVAECGGAFARGLHRRGILACGKHFPGGGSVPPADGSEIPESARPMAGLWRDDLLPFRANLPQLPLVLVSNAAYKAYDFDCRRAASLSSQIVQGLLRAKLGYDGLVLAHDLDSAMTRGTLSLGDAAVCAIGVGCDMLIVEKEESWLTMRRALAESVESGKLSPDRVSQALTRIGAAKKACAPTGRPLNKKAWHRLEKRFREFR